MCNMLLQFISEKFPDHGVLGEEGGIAGEGLKPMPPGIIIPVSDAIARLDLAVRWLHSSVREGHAHASLNPSNAQTTSD